MGDSSVARNFDFFQFSKRYVGFNIDNLCDVIASVSGSEKSAVSRIEKMEGGFSKAFLIAMENGSEYIHKIPCPNAGRPMYVLYGVRSRCAQIL
jgi:hypothetical protein